MDIDGQGELHTAGLLTVNAGGEHSIGHGGEVNKWDVDRKT